jgi:hypothetical protein
MEGLADVVAVQGDLAWAARHWGMAEALRETMGYPLPPVYSSDYEHAVTTARTHFGEKAFATAWAEGRMMKPEQALTPLAPAAIPGKFLR